MPKNAKSVHHRQQLQKVSGIIPFCSRQLAALVRHWMLIALIVGLRASEDGSHCEAAGVRREH